jgi:hypothetical protein
MENKNTSDFSSIQQRLLKQKSRNHQPGAIPRGVTLNAVPFGHLSLHFEHISTPEENMPKANRVNKKRNQFFFSFPPLDIIIGK